MSHKTKDGIKMVSLKFLKDINDMLNDINDTINSCEHYTFLKGQEPGLTVISLCRLFLSWRLIMSNVELLPIVGEYFPIPSLDNIEDSTQSENTHSTITKTNGCHYLATTYPRVLPANLPRVSEPERNQGESLVLPGLDVLPAPELLFNFDLGKNKRYNNTEQSQIT